MPTYEYECSKCGGVQEEFHLMNERPLIHCDSCRGACVKLIGRGISFNGLPGLYDFVDVNTTGKPIRFQSKRQWQSHLKSRGLTDDIPQGSIKAENLKPMRSEKTKQEKRKEYKQALSEVLKEKNII